MKARVIIDTVRYWMREHPLVTELGAAFFAGMIFMKALEWAL